MRDQIRTSEKSEAALLTEALQESVRKLGEAPRGGEDGRQPPTQRQPSTKRQPSVGKGTGRNAGGDGKPGPGKKFPWKPFLCVLVALAAAVSGAYLYKALSFQEAFLPHTVVNGRDVTGMTAEEVKELMAAGVSGYELNLLLRGGGRESIKGEDIGLHTVFDGSLEEIISQQNPYAWPRYLLKGPTYEIQTMIAFDEGRLDQVLGELDCFDVSLVKPPRDAYLSDYIEGQGYAIVPEAEGNQLDEALVKEAVAHGIVNLTPQLNLEELDCYRKAAVRADNPALISARDARNFYVNMTVTYTFGSETQVLDGDLIHRWLVVNGDSVALNGEMIEEFVRDLAKARNTAYTKRPFKTSYGDTVEVSGFYGWRINQAAEVQELTRVLESGESVTREPVYSQTAASHEGPDYGHTYAEVNLTAQHLFFYKDGELILESDFVSGNTSRGYTTPPGIFGLTYKERDAVLKGENYRSPVKFWMPFNGGIGFHDASWRSSFGGAIYKTNGSHGCINMPYAAAKTLFEHVYAGMPVICYNLPGTENSKSSRSSGTAPAATQAQTAPAATQAQTTPAATQAQTAPAATQAQTAPAATQAQTTPAAAHTQPEISIDPVEERQPENGGGSPAPGPGGQGPGQETTAGYGPAFGSATAGREEGPGV